MNKLEEKNGELLNKYYLKKKRINNKRLNYKSKTKYPYINFSKNKFEKINKILIIEELFS